MSWRRFSDWLAGRDPRREEDGRKLYDEWLAVQDDDDRMMSLDWEYLPQATREEFMLFARMLPALRVALARN